MATQSKLEREALLVRDALITKNTYNSVDDANNYGPTHSRALSDQRTPKAGKGTGIFMDTYNGGGDLDINGNPNMPGSVELRIKHFMGLMKINNTNTQIQLVIKVK